MSVRLFRFGIDYLRYNLCARFSHNHFAYLFVGLSQNSKQRFDVNFLGHHFDSIQYIETGQKMILNFYHDQYHVLTIERYLDMGVIHSVSYAVIFEGTFFAIPELFPFLVTFTQRYVRSLSVSRIDIALDCNVKTEKLWQSKRTQFRNDNVYRSGKHIETFYLGRQKGNKKYLIRVYDKKIDSQNKHKFVLFHHYLSEEIVTRIEAEVHTITAKILGITPEAILRYAKASIDGDEKGIEPLEQWFASLCMNEQGTFFYPLRGLALNKSEKLTTAKFTGRSENIEQHRYIRTLLTYAKHLHEMGFDVIGFLKDNLPLNETGSNQNTSISPPAHGS